MSRAKSRRELNFEDVLENLKQKGISIRVASPKLIMEEVIYIFLSFNFLRLVFCNHCKFVTKI